MNKQFVQLLTIVITVAGICIGAYILLISRVTALETNQNQQKEINTNVEKKLDKIIDLLIQKKQ